MNFAPIIIPEKYKYSDFFHKAVEYANENSLNTNEFCLKLSAYLFEHKKELRNAERRWLYNEKKLHDWWENKKRKEESK